MKNKPLSTKEEMMNKLIDMIREWHEDEPHPPIRPLVAKIQSLLKKERQSIITQIEEMAEINTAHGLTDHKQLDVLNWLSENYQFKK